MHPKRHAESMGNQIKQIIQKDEPSSSQMYKPESQKAISQSNQKSQLQKATSDTISIAPSTPNKFELAKKFQLNGLIEATGQVGINGQAPIDYLGLHQYVDAKDQVSNWCLAQIVDVNIDAQTVKIHFDGWSDRYDQDMPKKTQSLTPFRSHSRGYSGQQKIAFRQGWRLNPSTLVTLERRIKDIIDSKFMCFESAHECTQFIRGELYIFVDSVLTMGTNLSSSELPQVVDFMSLVFQLILTWMEIFPLYLQAFKECSAHKYIFCVDLPSAISQCGYELSEILGKIWGQCRRAHSVFSQFSQEYIVPGDFARKDKIKENGFALSLTNKFGELGGFDKIVKIMKGQNNLQFPLNLIGLFLVQFKLLPNYCEKIFVEDFAKNVSHYLMGRLDNMTDIELKEADKDLPKIIINVVEAFINICQPNTKVCEISETYELIIAKKYLTCPFFEKRIRGIAEFKEIFQKVQSTRNLNLQEQQLKQIEVPFAKYLTFQKYAEWLSQERILEFIFIESPHQEFIKRSLELLYLRAIDEHYPLDSTLIAGIWDCCTKKHEDIKRATFIVLQELVAYVKIVTLGQFWKLIKELKNSEVDEMHVNFLRKYTQGALSCLIISRAETEKTNQRNSGSSRRGVSQFNIDLSDYMSFDKLWEIGQETNRAISHQTRELALNCLIEILQKNAETKERFFINQPNKLTYIKYALMNMEESKSVYTSVEFLRKILLTFNLENNGQQTFKVNSNQKQTLTDNMCREDIISELLKQEIFQKVITNAAQYQERARQNLKSMKDIATTNDKLHSLKLGGEDDNKTHQEYIDCFMNFIEFIIKNSKSGNLTFQNLNTLYEHYVLKGVTEYEAKKFFLFLTRENENSNNRERKFLLNEKIRVDVFKNIMCNEQQFDSTNMHAEGFDCFKMLFLNVNNEKRFIDIDGNGNFVVNNLLQLTGMETLWDIVIHCSDNHVLQQSKNLLVDLYLKSKIQDSKKSQLVQSFLEKVMQENSNLQKKQVQQSSEHQSRWKLNWIQLIHCFISRFDYEHIDEENINKYNQAENLEIPVQLEPDKVTHIVSVNNKMLIWQLIIQIGKRFNMRLTEFEIITKSGPLSFNIYNQVMQQYEIQHINIQRKDEKQLNSENPRRLFSQKIDFINRLIQMIDQDKKDIKIKQEIISLMENFPVNQKMKEQLMIEIKLIKDPVGQVIILDVWSKIFDWDRNKSGSISANTFHTLTILHDCLILDEQRSNALFTKDQLLEEKKKRLEFSQIVIEKGGYEFFLLFFTSTDKKNIESSTLRNKALTILLQIIPYFFTQKLFPFVKKQTEQSIEQLFTENLCLIQSYITTVYLQQTQPQNSLINHNDKRILQHDTKMLDLALNLMQRIILLYPQQIQSLYKFPGIAQTFEYVWTIIESPVIQKLFSQVFYEICMKIDKQIIQLRVGDIGEDILDLQNLVHKQTVELIPSFYLIKLIFSQFMLKALQNHNQTSITSQMFNLANKICRETDVVQYIHLTHSSLSIDKLVIELATQIKTRPINEVSSSLKNEDTVLRFLFILMCTILTKMPQARQNFKEKNDFIGYLLNECLFMKESKRNLLIKGQTAPPKCKTQQTRDACMQLIKELLIENREGSIIFVEFLNKIIYSNDTCLFWRTPRKVDWNITSLQKNERSPTGFVGLKNIGCICYMNSILQQLYMIPSFRKAILEVEDKNINNEPDSQNVLYQIKRIFGGLMDLEKQYYNPKKFCEAFKDIDGSPIDPNVQKDVAEFFDPLIDKLETLIKDTKEEKNMKNLIYGAFANEVICHDCPHQSEREEKFQMIQLAVKNKKSVQESLDSYIEGDMLEGDNAYYCDKCEKKRNALKRQSIKRLPNVLFLCLKRFEFDYEKMTKLKINDYCSFPIELDMSPYCQEVITRNSLLKKMDEKSLSREDLTEDELIILNREITKSYYQFKLKGIVVHTGTSEYGHYYSYIQDRQEQDVDNQWYCFNDSVVESFDPNNIPDQTFGGENENFEYQLSQHANDPAMLQAMKNQGKMKQNNAYILIYERENFIDQEKFREFTDDVKNTLQSKQSNVYQQASKKYFNDCRLPSTVSSQIQITPQIQDQILEKNRRFWLTKYIFNKPFLEQMQEIFDQFKFKGDFNYKSAKNQSLQAVDTRKSNVRDDLEILKFQVSFVITVAIRAQTRTQIPTYIQMIRTALKNNVQLSLWFLETFSNLDIIREFLVECPVHDMARFVSGLLKTSMQTVYPDEEKLLLEYINQLEKGNILNYIKTVAGGQLEIKTKFITHSSSVISSTVTPGQTPIGPSTHVVQDEGPVIYSPASQVDIVTFKEHVPQQIPMIVVLINSLLHYQSSASILEKLNFTAQLHSLIGHFANLGPVARLYLLKTGTLLRLLRTLFHSQIHQTISNQGQTLSLASEQDKEGILAKNVPILQIQSEKPYISANQQPIIESKLMSAERRQILQTCTPPFTFIINTISLLVRSCQFVPPIQGQPYSSLFNGELKLNYKPEKNELDFLINQSTNKVWWFSQSIEFPFVRNAVANMFAHICFGDDQFSQKYIKETFKMVNCNDFLIIKKFERPLLICLNIEDAYQAQRITATLNYLHEVLKKNIQFWKFCDQTIELIYKLALRCRPFAIELEKNKNIVKQIESITNTNPCFPVNNQSKMKIFKDGNINWQNLANKKNLINEKKVEVITNYSKSRLQKLQNILKLGQQIMTVDSDDDCYGHVFQQQDIIDVKYRYQKKELAGWHQAKVIFALDEMVRAQTPIRLQNGKEQFVELWIETESSKIGWSETYTQNEKSENFLYFQDLYKFIEPAESEPGSNSSTAISEKKPESSQNMRPSTQGNNFRN